MVACTYLSTGIALLYLHLHNVFKESSFLQRALEYVSHSLKCLTRRHDVTFLCGDAGPLAVAAVVYYRLQRGQETDECINRLLKNKWLLSLMYSFKMFVKIVTVL